MMEYSICNVLPMNDWVFGDFRKGEEFIVAVMTNYWPSKLK